MSAPDALRLDTLALEQLAECYDSLRSVAGYLTTAGYTLERIAALLGMLEPPEELLRNTMVMASLYGPDLESAQSPLAVLASLFLFGMHVDVEAFVRALPEPVRNNLERRGFVNQRAREVVSTVSITEIGGRHFVSDRLFDIHRSDGLPRLRAERDAVWPPAAWSLDMLAQRTRNAGHKSLLDVGCGTGVVSILAAGEYSTVRGLDINPRAVAYARVNASLNGVGRAVYELADVFEVEVDGRYDCVVWVTPSGPSLAPAPNGPVVASARTQLGHDWSIRFIDESADSLMTDAGLCQLWSVFCLGMRDRSVTDLIKRSVRDPDRFDFEATRCPSAGLCVPPECIAHDALPPDCNYAGHEEAARFFAMLRDHDVREVVPAVVTVRRRRFG